MSLAKQDKPCTARPFSSWGSGGAVSPSAGSGVEPRELLKISRSPITKLTDFDCLSQENSSIVTG